MYLRGVGDLSVHALLSSRSDKHICGQVLVEYLLVHLLAAQGVYGDVQRMRAGAGGMGECGGTSV